MLPKNLLHMQPLLRSLYSMCIEPVCQKYGVNRTELDILLFLANNPEFDTAAEVANIRLLAKSHVSTSLHSLEKSGYITKSIEEDDKRLIHLKLTARADKVVKEGQARQMDVLNIMTAGLDKVDQERLHFYILTMENNIKDYLEAHTK